VIEGGEMPPGGQMMRTVTEISELASITSGSASYTQLGIPLFNADTGAPDGSYDFSALLDFGAQELRGGFADPSGQGPVFVNNVNSTALGIQGESGFFDQIPLTGSGPAQFGLQDGFFDEQVDGGLFITFFNEPGHLTGTSPETAASNLILTGQDFSQNPSVIVDIIGGAETPRD
jgi:hypothetical protein